MFSTSVTTVNVTVNVNGASFNRSWYFQWKLHETIANEDGNIHGQRYCRVNAFGGMRTVIVVVVTVVAAATTTVIVVVVVVVAGVVVLWSQV